MDSCRTYPRASLSSARFLAPGAGITDDDDPIVVSDSEKVAEVLFPGVHVDLSSKIRVLSCQSTCTNKSHMVMQTQAIYEGSTFDSRFSPVVGGSTRSTSITPVTSFPLISGMRVLRHLVLGLHLISFLISTRVQKQPRNCLRSSGSSPRPPSLSHRGCRYWIQMWHVTGSTFLSFKRFLKRMRNKHTCSVR